MLRADLFVAMSATLIAAFGNGARAVQKSSLASPPPQSAEVSQLARQAQEALNRGETETAVRDYEKLVKMLPSAGNYYADLGMAYYSAGRFQNAAQALRQALTLKPGLGQARFLLGASLAESGRCPEALLYLKKDAAHAADSQLKRTGEADGLRCALALDQEDSVAEFLQMLQHDFPNDPEVLYLKVHAYSDLSTRAAQKLLVTAPASIQVNELSAEALEAQEKWDEAAAEYRKILTKDPSLPGIHYRLGRLLLTKPRTPTSLDEARHEFEEELKADPTNAGAEYVLGELARQARQWPAAIEHFSRASKLDPTFVDAFIGLGKSLVSAGRVPEAVRPLETATRLQPDNPVAHYQLAFAYRRAGRTHDADKELLAYRQANERARRALQDIRSAILGRTTPAQTEEPPE